MAYLGVDTATTFSGADVAPDLSVTSYISATPPTSTISSALLILTIATNVSGNQNLFITPTTLNGTATTEIIAEDNCDAKQSKWLKAKFIMLAVFGTGIAIIGVLGNLINILVLGQPKGMSANKVYLIVLAIYDTLVLIGAFLIYSVEHISEYTQNFQLYSAWVHYLRYAFCLSHLTQTGSVYTTVAVTLEQYIEVANPRRSAIFSSRRGCAITILLVALFAIAFNASKFFEISTETNPACEGFASVYPVPGVLLLNAAYQEIFSLWISSIVMILFPFLVLLLANIAIITTVRRQTIARKRTLASLHPPPAEDVPGVKEATVVLIVVVLWFLACNFWSFVLTLAERLYGDKTLSYYYPKFYAFSREAINLLAIFNAAGNFFIYYGFGRQFRDQFHQLFCCFCPQLIKRHRVGEVIKNPEDLEKALNELRENYHNKVAADAKKNSVAVRKTVVWLNAVTNGEHMQTIEHFENSAPPPIVPSPDVLSKIGLRLSDTDSTGSNAYKLSKKYHTVATISPEGTNQLQHRLRRKKSSICKVVLRNEHAKQNIIADESVEFDDNSRKFSNNNSVENEAVHPIEHNFNLKRALRTNYARINANISDKLNILRKQKKTFNDENIPDTTASTFDWDGSAEAGTSLIKRSFENVNFQVADPNSEFLDSSDGQCLTLCNFALKKVGSVDSVEPLRPEGCALLPADSAYGLRTNLVTRRSNFSNAGQSSGNDADNTRSDGLWLIGAHSNLGLNSCSGNPQTENNEGIVGKIIVDRDNCLFRDVPQLTKTLPLGHDSCCSPGRHTDLGIKAKQVLPNPDSPRPQQWCAATRTCHCDSESHSSDICPDASVQLVCCNSHPGLMFDVLHVEGGSVEESIAGLLKRGRSEALIHPSRSPGILANIPRNTSVNRVEPNDYKVSIMLSGSYHSLRSACSSRECTSVDKSQTFQHFDELDNLESQDKARNNTRRDRLGQMSSTLMADKITHVLCFDESSGGSRMIPHLQHERMVRHTPTTLCATRNLEQQQQQQQQQHQLIKQLEPVNNSEQTKYPTKTVLRHEQQQLTHPPEALKSQLKTNNPVKLKHLKAKKRRDYTANEIISTVEQQTPSISKIQNCNGVSKIGVSKCTSATATTEQEEIFKCEFSRYSMPLGDNSKLKSVERDAGNKIENEFNIMENQYSGAERQRTISSGSSKYELPCQECARELTTHNIDNGISETNDTVQSILHIPSKPGKKRYQIDLIEYNM